MQNFINKQTALVYMAVVSSENAERMTRNNLRFNRYANVIKSLQYNNLLTKASSFDKVDWFAIHKALFLAPSNAPQEARMGVKTALEEYFQTTYESYKMTIDADRIVYA